jgi:hypothetical protein
MTIENSLKMINCTQKIVTGLQTKYKQNTAALLELNKLSDSLQTLFDYLNKLDQLQPHYNTNNINAHMEGINLHLDILKEELAKKDYSTLAKGIKAIRIILKFHPTKYSFFTFIIAWFFELIYFI